MGYARVQNGKVLEITEMFQEGWEHFTGPVAVDWQFCNGSFIPPAKEDPIIDLSTDEIYNSPSAQLARINGRIFDALIKAVLTGNIIELQSLEDHAALLRPHI